MKKTPVFKYNYCGDFIKKFSSIKEASRCLNISTIQVKEACKDEFSGSRPFFLSYGKINKKRTFFDENYQGQFLLYKHEECDFIKNQVCLFENYKDLIANLHAFFLTEDEIDEIKHYHHTRFRKNNYSIQQVKLFK